MATNECTCTCPCARCLNEQVRVEWYLTRRVYALEDGLTEGNLPEVLGEQLSGVKLLRDGHEESYRLKQDVGQEWAERVLYNAVEDEEKRLVEGSRRVVEAILLEKARGRNHH